GALTLDGVGLAETVDDHVGTLARQFTGNGQTDAAGGTGDDRFFTFEHDALLLQECEKNHRTSVTRSGRTQPCPLCRSAAKIEPSCQPLLCLPSLWAHRSAPSCAGCSGTP